MGMAIELCCLLSSLSPNVLSVEETPLCLLHNAKEPVGDSKHVPLGYSCNTPRPGWKENLFYTCVSSYNLCPWQFCSWRSLEKITPQEPVSTLRSPQQADSAAGCQSGSGALLRLVCNVAKPLGKHVNLRSGLFLVHSVALPRKCPAAAVTHNLILSCCVRVGNWWLEDL